MIGWLGFVGKLLQFCLEKVVGKKIDLRMDERKHAAISFIRLYNSIQDLEAICAQALTMLQPVVSGDRKRLRGEWVRQLSETTDKASSEFLATARELVGALRIFDPTLALMLGQLRYGKFVFLSLSSGFDQFTSPFELKTDATGRLESLGYSTPSDDLENLDFESVYQGMQGWGTLPFLERDWYPEVDERGEFAVKAVALEWPKDSLLNLLEGRIVNHVVLPTDLEQITVLYKLAERHLSLLTHTREMLRAFIRENFKIDDLLFVFGRQA